MTIRKTAYVPTTFTTTDKVIREYQKEKKDVILYTSTCKQRLTKQYCYCHPSILLHTQLFPSPTVCK